MATLKCLACGHDNNVGDEWCSSCSSSLNLRLCSACEAINADDAQRCHSCNAELRIEPQAVTFDALPAVLRLSTDHARRRSSRFTAVLAVLPLLAAGGYFFFYAASRASEAPHVAPNVEVAPKSDPAPDAEAVPKERAASAQPKRATAAVTHTRSARAAPTTLPVSATVPVSTTLPVSATSDPALNAPILPVSEIPAAISELRRTVPAEATSGEPAGCAPAVAALGLCKTR